MSNDTKSGTASTTRNTHGAPPSTTPSVGKLAATLDPDRPVWEQQQGETKQAYDAFIAFRDSEDRKVRPHGPSAQRWSSRYSWGYRAFEYDKYLVRKDAEDAVRYRRSMNDRHRRIAGAMLTKVVQRLQSLDPSKLSPADLVRWVEAAAKIERLAGGQASEVLGLQTPGRVDSMSAEEVAEALQALVSEIRKVTVEA